MIFWSKIHVLIILRLTPFFFFTRQQFDTYNHIPNTKFGGKKLSNDVIEMFLKFRKVNKQKKKRKKKCKPTLNLTACKMSGWKILKLNAEMEMSFSKSEPVRVDSVRQIVHSHLKTKPTKQTMCNCHFHCISISPTLGPITFPILLTIYYYPFLKYIYLLLS